MGRKRVHSLVLLTFVVAVSNCADSNTTDTSTTANAVTSSNTSEPVSTSTTDPAIPDNPVTLPPPDPSVTKFNYYVRDPETGVACILANMSISIMTAYESTNGDNKIVGLKVPPAAEVRGTCRGTAPTMELIWAEDPTLEGALNGIAFIFGSTENTFFLQDIAYELYIDNKNFPDAKNQGGRFGDTLWSINKFSASKNDGLYKCALLTMVDNADIFIIFANVSLIAFNTENSVATKTEENCEPESEPTLTPLPPPDLSVTEFNYYVRDLETGVACILANVSISIKVNYISTSYDIKTAVLEVPPTAEVRGTCKGTVPIMELIWTEEPTLEGALNGIALTFGSTGNVSYLQDIGYELYMDNKTFPEAIDEGGRFRGTLKRVYKFVASKNNGLYKCEPKTTVGTKDIDITITNVALIAFNTEQSVATKTEENCEPENEPITSPLPLPDPSVTEFNYYVRDLETGVACILANMSISIKANYTSTSYDTKTALLKIPPTAEVSGTCRGAVPTMEFIWTEEPTLEGALNGIAFIFGSTENTFFLQDIVYELYIDNKTFPDAKNQGRRFGTELQKINKFSASKNGGLYRCESETTVGTKDIEITITNIALIAFNTKESVATRTEENCVAAPVTGADVGAIVGGVIGGVALIAIIIILIVVWRKKCR